MSGDLERLWELEREIDRLDRLIEWKEKDYWKVIEKACELIEQGAPYDVLKDEEERILKQIEELERKRDELIRRENEILKKILRGEEVG